MEPIKIVDKLTLRQEALRVAVELSKSNVTYDAIASAEKYEEYLLGSADLPEYVDPQSEHKYFADLLAKMQENFKTPPLSMWISADSEMRPEDNMTVVVRFDGCNDCFIGKYTRELGWEVKNAPYNSSIVAWTIIPPFVEPIKL